MKKLFSLFLTLLLVLSSTTFVFAVERARIDQTITIPLYVRDTYGVYDDSGLAVTFQNNFAAPIDIITAEPQFRISSLPQMVEFEIDILPSEQAHDFDFTVTSNQVAITRSSPTRFRMLVNSVQNITITVNPVGAEEEDPDPPIELLTTVTMGATPNNGGTVLPATSQHPAGSEVNITAIPATNWHFQRWHSADLSIFEDATNSSTTLTVPTQNVVVTAIFAQTPPLGTGDLELTLNIRGEGAVQGAGVYPAGTVVNILAAPSEGYRFIRWELIGVGNVTPADNPSARVTMSSDVTLTAVFEREAAPMFAVSFHPANGFTFTGAGLYSPGETVTIQAHNTNPTTEFVQWNMDANIQVANRHNNPTTFIMPDANVPISIATRTVTPTHTLTVTAERGGWIQGTSSFTLAQGAITEIRAQAEHGYEFDRWVSSGGGNFGAAQNRISTFTMPNNPVTVTATFRATSGGTGDITLSGGNQNQTTGTITVTAEPSDGGEPRVTNSQPARAGQNRSIEARPCVGWEFDRWEIVGGQGRLANNRQANTNFTMGERASDVEIIAHFTRAGFNVINNQSNIAVLSPNPTTNLTLGTIVTIQVNDPQNRVPSTIPLTAAGNVQNPTAQRQGDSSVFTFVMPAANVTIGAITQWMPGTGTSSETPTPPHQSIPNLPQPTPTPQPTATPTPPLIHQNMATPQTPAPTPTPAPAVTGNTTVVTTQVVSNSVDALDIGTGLLSFSPHAPVDEVIDLDKTNDLMSLLWISVGVLGLAALGLIVHKKKRHTNGQPL